MFPTPPYPMNKRKSMGEDENGVKKSRNEEEQNSWMTSGYYWNQGMMAGGGWQNAVNPQHAFWSQNSRVTPPLDLKNLQNLQNLQDLTTTTVTPVNFAANPALTSSTLLTPESDLDESRDSSEWQVEGRLPVVNKKSKYVLEADQVRRRCEAPECMNFTTLIKFFKKCKNKENIKKMKAFLAENNINVPVMQHQKVYSSFTMLTEQECVMMTEDMGYLLKTFFPKATLGRKMLEKLCEQGKSLTQCMQSLNNSILCMNQIITTISSRQPAIAGASEKIKRHPLDARLDTECQQLNKKYETFSRLTHGYGPADSLNYYKKFREVFEEAMVCCETILSGRYVELTKGKYEKKEWKYEMKVRRADGQL